MKILEMCMYYLSFVPLWISVIFIDTLSLIKNSSCLYTEKISLVIITIGTLVSFFVVKKRIHPHSLDNVQPYKLIEVHEDKLQTTEFIASYVLPLFAFDFTTWYDVILFLIFFIFLGYLCVRHNHLCPNVVLDLIFNFRTYTCTLKNEDEQNIEMNILSNHELLQYKNKHIIAKGINNDFLIEIHSEN